LDRDEANGPAVSALERLIVELFQMPGAGDNGVDRLLRGAACAHKMLLSRAAADTADRKSGSGPLLCRIASLVGRIPGRRDRDRFLLDPTFIEALHAAANDSPSLADWHHQIAHPSVAGAWSAASLGEGSQLGNALMVLLLRDDPNWQGELRMQTDLFGRLRFPQCDWSVALWSKRQGRSAVCSQQEIAASITRHDVRLSLPGRRHDELLVVPRSEWQRMIVGNSDRLNCRQIVWPQGDIAVSLQFTSPIPGWHVSYDPVGGGDDNCHADLTGGIVAAALGAIAQRAPSVAAEFDARMFAVRSCELPPAGFGTLQSFSDPTLPRVMGINVSYSADDLPLLCPFCFTWFGHELGHTICYLIETILFVHGQRLTNRHGHFTATIPRYGRGLPVRTLLQIPYTHLYEWMLMIEFLEGGFSALPWTIDDDPFVFADDLRAEVVEAFDLIDRDTSISAVGRVAVSRVRDLYAQVLERWRRIHSNHETEGAGNSLLKIVPRP
jgi:hypothetical protein